MTFQDEVYQIADDLRVTASIGLRFAKEPSVENRYRRALTASARLVGMLEQRQPEDILTDYEKVPPRWGPMLASCAVGFNEGRILLVRDKDAGLWVLPAGLLPIDQTLAQGAQCNLRDQANLSGRAQTVLGIFDSRTWHYPAKSQLYHVAFEVETGSELATRTKDRRVGFFSEDDLPALSPGFSLIVPLLFELDRGEIEPPYFDLGDHNDTLPPSAAPELPEPSQSAEPNFRGEIQEIALKLSKAGTEGLKYPDSEYDKHNYQLMLSAADRLVSSLKSWSPHQAFVRYEDNLSHEGPRIAALAAVFREGQLLLIRRADSGLWALPGGMTDIGETWARCAQRELWEETAVKGRVTRLLGVFDWRVLRDPPKPLLLATFLVEEEGRTEPNAMPETLGAGFFDVDDLPQLSPGYERLVPLAINLFQGKIPAPYVDLSPL